MLSESAGKIYKISSLCLFCILVVTGCLKDKTVTYEIRPTVAGQFKYRSLSDPICNGDIKIFNVPSQPVIFINDESYQTQLGEGGFFYSGYFPEISGGDSIRISIDFTNAQGYEASCSAFLYHPEELETMAYNQSYEDTFYTGNDIIYHWTNSTGADYYNLQIYFEYYYSFREPSDSSEWVTYYKDTTVTDNTITIYNDSLYPDSSIFDELYGYGIINVQAICGPYIPGEIGNVTGDAVGIIQASSIRKQRSIRLLSNPE